MNYTSARIRAIADELRVTVDETAEKLSRIDEETASRRPAPGKWSQKEIIGHLIDSAANNHQRFVRAPQAASFEGPDYRQDDWVEQQGYNEREMAEIVAFWRMYNQHLATIITRIPEESLGIECRVGDYDPAPLGWVVEDYLVHLKHHLNALSAL
jgi:hypothetical protein